MEELNNFKLYWRRWKYNIDKWYVCMIKIWRLIVYVWYDSSMKFNLDNHLKYDYQDWNFLRF